MEMVHCDVDCTREYKVVDLCCGRNPYKLLSSRSTMFQVTGRELVVLLLPANTLKSGSKGY